jgi:anti-sigma regulatory factor (Ser/Thr protein kinase)
MAQFSKKNFARKELFKIFISILILMVAGTIYYFYIRKDALHTAERRAEYTLKNTERTILIRMGKIETSVNAILPMVEYALDDPDAMFEIAEHIFESSSRIMGAGIAFEPDYFPEKGHWYETYVGYQKGSDTLVIKQLGCKEHNYFEMDWYKDGKASPDGSWSNPYYDNAGGKTFLITYSIPIRDSLNQVVGVIGTDVTLDTLASIIRSVELYPHSFCTLTTCDGNVVVGPPSTVKTKGKVHVFSEKIDGKDFVLTLTVPDSDMYKRLRKATLFFTLLALTGIFSVFFISYRSLQNLWKLNEVRMKEQQIENELSIARNIQAALLPDKSTVTSNKSLDICGMQSPARFVGGDLYDFYIRNNKLLFCIGDVSGKGVPAALLMAISHSLFRTISSHNERPEIIMEALNNAISDNNPDIMFITMFLGILDLNTGTISYCNAGHNPPIVIKDGQAKYLDTEPSLLLGVESSANYTSHELTLAPGDSLFLYTDGLTEAENAKKEVFGDARALETATRFGTLTAEQQIEQMHQAVHQFVNDAEQSDDLTMLAIRYVHGGNTLVLENRIQELDKLMPFLNHFFEQENIDMSLLPQLDLALEEAATNVIMYAYPEGETGTAELEMELKDGQIHSILSDSGTPFDPLQRPDVNLDVSLEERAIGGLGIHLIKEIMNEVNYEYSDGKNILTMTFDLHKTLPLEQQISND